MEATRARRRSALKAHDVQVDTTEVLGRKRVSFSRNLAEIRNFRHSPSDSESNGAGFDTKRVMTELNLTGSLPPVADYQESIVYQPMLDDLTVNFNQAANDTLMFAEDMKTCSTPSRQHPPARKLVKRSAEQKVQPITDMDMTRIDGNQNQLASSDMDISLSHRVYRGSSGVSSMNVTYANQERRRSRMGVVDNAQSDDQSVLLSAEERRISQQLEASDSSDSGSDVITVEEALQLFSSQAPHSSTVAHGHPSSSAVADGHPSSSAVADGHPSSSVVADGHPRNSAVADGHPRPEIVSTAPDTSIAKADIKACDVMAEGDSLFEPSELSNMETAGLSTSRRRKTCSTDGGGKSRSRLQSLSIRVSSPLSLPEKHGGKPALPALPAQSMSPSQLISSITIKDLEVVDDKIAGLHKELERLKATRCLQLDVERAKERTAAALRHKEDAEKKLLALQNEQTALYDKVTKDNKHNQKCLEMCTKIAALQLCVLWKWEPQDDINMHVFKFPLGCQSMLAQLELTLTVDSLEKMAIQGAKPRLVDVLRMPSYGLFTLKRLLELAALECDSNVGVKSLPLLLHMLSRLVDKTNSFLLEVENCLSKCGWFEFRSDTIEYTVRKTTGWSCVYLIKNMDIVTYPESKLSFTCRAKSGPVPQRMFAICKELNAAPSGEKYFTRCCTMIRETRQLS